MYVSKRYLVIDDKSFAPDQVIDIEMSESRIKKMLAADLIMESVEKIGDAKFSVEISLENVAVDDEGVELSPIEKLDPERKPSRRKA